MVWYHTITYPNSFNVWPSSYVYGSTIVHHTTPHHTPHNSEEAGCGISCVSVTGDTSIRGGGPNKAHCVSKCATIVDCCKLLFLSHHHHENNNAKGRSFTSPSSKCNGTM
eukprot:scaffold15321_cov174-Amphora_coffeaeformis.AAC.2